MVAPDLRLPDFGILLALLRLRMGPLVGRRGDEDERGIGGKSATMV